MNSTKPACNEEKKIENPICSQPVHPQIFWPMYKDGKKDISDLKNYAQSIMNDEEFCKFNGLLEKGEPEILVASMLFTCDKISELRLDVEEEI